MKAIDKKASDGRIDLLRKARSADLRVVNIMQNKNGFTLIELAIVLAISTMALIATWPILETSMREDRGQALGQQLMVVDGAVKTYYTENYAELVSAVPVIPGFVDPFRPTTTELRTAGYLTQETTDNTLLGSGYDITLTQTPAGCTSPDCDISALVTTTTPACIRPGDATIDTAALGAGVREIGGNGGYATTAATIDGLSGSWSTPNTLGVAGILAVRSGYGSSGFKEFYRRDGSLPLTASLNMGGQTIKDIQSVVVGDACANTGEIAQDSNGEVVSCQNGRWQRQNRYWKEPVERAADLPICNATIEYQTRIIKTPSVGTGPRAYTCDGAGWMPLAVDDLGNLIVPAMLTADIVFATTSITTPIIYDADDSNYKLDPDGTSDLSYVSLDEGQLNNIKSEGTACSKEGGIARDASGLILSCQSSGTIGGACDTVGDTAVEVLNGVVTQLICQ